MNPLVSVKEIETFLINVEAHFWIHGYLWISEFMNIKKWIKNGHIYYICILYNVHIYLCVSHYFHSQLSKRLLFSIATNTTQQCFKVSGTSKTPKAALTKAKMEFIYLLLNFSKLTLRWHENLPFYCIYCQMINWPFADR